MPLTTLLMVLLIAAGCSSFAGSDCETAVSGEFVGTTPEDFHLREFLGGIDAHSPCPCVTWQITLFTYQQNRLPANYTLVATYGLPGRDDPNQIETGPTVKMEGPWRIVQSDKAKPANMIYEIHAPNGRLLRLRRLGEHLLHFIDPVDRLMVGNGGWSYTLNRKGIGHEN